MSIEHQLMTQETAPSPRLQHTPKYKRLTQAQLGIILALTREGKTQTQIAQVIGCDQKAVSDALRALGTDSTELAVHRAKSSSYRAVKRLDAVVRKGSDDHAIKASSKLLEVAGVLNGDSKGVSVGVQVIIGDGPDPLAGAKVVSVCTSEGAK
jgi:DNA-binding CsgD family transcriptional regulator